LPATFPRDDNTSAIDNRNDIISEKENRTERGIFDGVEQYCKNCSPKENTLEINYWQVPSTFMLVQVR